MLTAPRKINRIVKNGIFGNERIATLLKREEPSSRISATHLKLMRRLRVEQKKKDVDTRIYGLATFLDARFKDRLSEGRTCFREQGTGWIEQEAKDLIVDTDSVEPPEKMSPSTSVASEQLFSVAWNVFHYRRFNLAPKNAELLVFLNKVLSLLHYQY
uniref:HAT C-terminal dimerisation domain-containing protein n=1 Tax=Ditylenchus dipsaci TaxID=166011 RepID=A0A915EKG2_9BILA